MHCSTDWFRNQVLSWYDQHGRKHLPWQQEKTAYKVWLSEIMLQQTQVATVIPYFERFLEQFPNVQSLAAAPVDEVLQLWTGLGYYARARNLHKAAKQVCAQFNGIFPSDPALLETLPGVGRSTAAAIASSAYDVPAAILDGNVKRVLSRFFALQTWPGGSAEQKQLWQWSDALTPKLRCADYNQVMMDLGALVCTRSKPSCSECPLAAECLALAHDQVSRLPVAKPKKEKPVRAVYMLMRQNPAGDVLLHRRADSGIWGGLFSFPEYTELSALEQDVAGSHYDLWPEFRHTFSHYHLDITPVWVPQSDVPGRIEEGDRLWFNPQLTQQNDQAIGLPAPVVRLLQKIQQQM